MNANFLRLEESKHGITHISSSAQRRQMPLTHMAMDLEEMGTESRKFCRPFQIPPSQIFGGRGLPQSANFFRFGASQCHKRTLSICNKAFALHIATQTQLWRALLWIWHPLLSFFTDSDLIFYFYAFLIG